MKTMRTPAMRPGLLISGLLISGLLLFGITFRARPAASVAPARALRAAATPGPAEHLFYDARRQQLVLLTASAASGREELWGWDGGAWSLIPGGGPAARETSGAAYDTRRMRLVLHGGMGMTDREDRRGDTWEWDGDAWHEMTDPRVGTRDHHALAYDERRGRTVMFGGVRSGETLETDTWEWDGATWRRMATDGPGGRAHFAMAYDSVHKRVVLYGGMGAGYEALGDTWAWDGRAWHQLAGAGPPPRTHHRMTYDSRAGVLLLFGGLRAGDPTQALDDTWILEDRRWRQVSAPGPGRRSGHVMAYDPVRRRTVLHGGGSFDGRESTLYDDTWAWDGARWTQIR